MTCVVIESKKDNYSDPFLLYKFAYQCKYKGKARQARLQYVVLVVMMIEHFWS